MEMNLDKMNGHMNKKTQQIVLCLASYVLDNNYNQFEQLSKSILQITSNEAQTLYQQISIITNSNNSTSSTTKTNSTNATLSTTSTNSISATPTPEIEILNTSNNNIQNFELISKADSFMNDNNINDTFTKGKFYASLSGIH
eukprot:89352_1